MQHAGSFHEQTHGAAHARVVRDPFCEDVRCALKRFFYVRDTRCGIDIRCCKLRGIVCGVLLRKTVRKRLQSLRLCDGGAGVALLLVGKVQIFKRGQRCGVLDRRTQFLRHRAL